MAEEMNAPNFNLDLRKAAAPFVRLASETIGVSGDHVNKYDIRFKQPNQEHMDMTGLHSLEHLMAEYIRDYLNHVLDISPMGSQTGFYVTVLNNDSYEDITDALEKTLQDILTADEVPACSEEQCGWAENHSLDGAKTIAEDMLKRKDEWDQVYAS